MSAKKRVVHRTPYPHIVKIDGVSSGQAIIEGTRIAVWHIVGYYYKADSHLVASRLINFPISQSGLQLGYD